MEPMLPVSQPTLVRMPECKVNKNSIVISVKKYLSYSYLASFNLNTYKHFGSRWNTQFKWVYTVGQKM